MISFKEYLKESEDPCWDGYTQYGMKKKNGKKVPNCVPEEKECQCEKDCECEEGYVSDAQRKAVWASRNEKGIKEAQVDEATYKGKQVTLNKPTKGDVKKSKVYVDPDGDGKAKKVEFGDPNMSIKKHIPARRKSFRARHNCDNPGPKDKARYWSCKAW